jgi:hypothetical protein
MEAGEEEAKEEAIVFGSAKTVFRIAVWVVNIECAAAAVTEYPSEQRTLFLRRV